MGILNELVSSSNCSRSSGNGPAQLPGSLPDKINFLHSSSLNPLWAATQMDRKIYRISGSQRILESPQQSTEILERADCPVSV